MQLLKSVFPLLFLFLSVFFSSLVHLFLINVLYQIFKVFVREIVIFIMNICKWVFFGHF